jgi:hypothetical protein
MGNGNIADRPRKRLGTNIRHGSIKHGAVRRASPRPNGGVADSLDEAKAAFRAAGDAQGQIEPLAR